ncbi:L-aspartate oxidase [Candidatus Poribacteria bacterium]|nr:MAG: L-aspartate oxidase [Candidatus Poribacteria bacterium]
MTRRYIVQFDSAKLPRIDTDFLVIGDGNAGLSAAIEASQHGDVLLITKRATEEDNYPHTQDGAIAIMSKDGTRASHVEKTLGVGKGLCNKTAVEVMVEKGLQQVSDLIPSTTNRDKKEETTLLNQREKWENVRAIEQAFAVDLMTEGDNCYGVVALIDDALHCIFAKATILASGGLGHIYQCTSNPVTATGDGFAAAWRAGCEMMDMEFVQFHPTILFLMEAPYCLISERVREEGGVLVSSRGERFMAKYHELEELAPCDVVGRAILNEMELTGSPCVYLDVTHFPPDFVRNRFSDIYQFCHEFGIDITTDVIPVRSGADFMIGGVRTNLNGETTLHGLYVCGEVACTGVHGAGRLANNSLFECMVFGARAGRAAAEYVGTIQSHSYASMRISSDDDFSSFPTPSSNIEIEAAQELVQEMMWRHVGLVRHGEDLEVIFGELKALNLSRYLHTVQEFEFQNMCDVAGLMTEAAILRTESRGVHYRADFREQNDVEWQKHIVLQQGQTARIVA